MPAFPKMPLIQATWWRDGLQTCVRSSLDGFECGDLAALVSSDCSECFLCFWLSDFLAWARSPRHGTSWMYLTKGHPLQESIVSSSAFCIITFCTFEIFKAANGFQFLPSTLARVLACSAFTTCAHHLHLAFCVKFSSSMD